MPISLAENLADVEAPNINIDSLKRIEIENRLTSEEYINELINADPSRGQIIKDRYCLCYKSQYFEIDVYPFKKITNPIHGNV